MLSLLFASVPNELKFTCKGQKVTFRRDTLEDQSANENALPLFGCFPESKLISIRSDYQLNCATFLYRRH